MSIQGQYKATQVARPDGSNPDIQTDTYGNLITVPLGGVAPVVGQSLTQYRKNDLVTFTLFTGAKKLKSVTGYNPGSTLYLQIWDNATAGSGSLVYETEITLGVAAAPTVGGDSLTPDYITIGTACTYGFSTTSGTYTAFGGTLTGLRCEVMVAA